MPVSFQIDDSTGAVFTTASGIVSYAELIAHIKTKSKRGLMARPELFDASDVTLDLSLVELNNIADKTKEALGSQTPGRIAVVTNSAFVYGLAKAYAAISREQNPQFQVFQSDEDAHAWLGSEALE